ESKENELNAYERHSVVVFKENLDEFMSQLTKAAETLKSIKPAPYTKKIPHKISSSDEQAASFAAQTKKPIVRIKKNQDQQHEHKKKSPRSASVVSIRHKETKDANAVQNKTDSSEADQNAHD
ncbi:MAG TPA: hypothetical protein PLV76_03085, partial [Spirochaetales bacterium]|nr:hypothetical protein [Spirochaetales bacterium]